MLFNINLMLCIDEQQSESLILICWLSACIKIDDIDWPVFASFSYPSVSHTHMHNKKGDYDGLSIGD